jgi:hypothetical protein
MNMVFQDIWQAVIGRNGRASHRGISQNGQDYPDSYMLPKRGLIIIREVRRRNRAPR